MQETEAERKVPLWLIAVGSALVILVAGLLLVGWRSPRRAVRPAEQSQRAESYYRVAESELIIDDTVHTKGIPVPVLMYHEIREGPNNLYLPAQQLADQLEAMQHEGYVAITLAQLYQAYTRGAKLPLHPVVLTFDDGYASFYTNALPLLKQHGYPATLFVITGAVGQPGYITWEQVREMAAAGIEMGGHTVNHPDLTKLEPNRQSFEVAESRRVLEQQVGRPVRFFAYPAGRYNDRTLAITREAGYLAAVTTVSGLAGPGQDVFQWERIRVNPGISGKALVARLRSLEAAAAGASGR